MSEEKSKGISLRRKKTTRPTISARNISAPRQIPTQQSLSRDRSADSRNPSLWETQTNDSEATRNLSVPGREPRPSLGGDKTSDLVKRRYSTRFVTGAQQAQWGDGGLTPPVPAMPSLPAQYAQSRRSGDSRSPSRDGRSPERPGTQAGSRLRVDVRAIKDPNLQASQYVQSLLAEATEEDVHSYQNELQNLKAHTSTDLQHNVYQNRTQFIKISKEADRLKTEMRALRTLMSDLTGALGHAATAAGNSDAGLTPTSALSLADRKRANRSSVANLEALWSTHLQTLWKRVEGSQKYLPALPGRHIVMESQRWVELNAATWKPRRRVCLVLLNDHLLVASEKKRNDLLPGGQNANGNGAGSRMSVYNPGASAGGQGQSTTQTTALVTERCWALQDVSLADISTRQSTSVGHSHSRENTAIANAINIRAGNESLTYATSDSAEKAGLLVAFRKAQEDLRKLMAAEHGERERALDEIAFLTGRDPRLLKKAAADEVEASKASGAAGLGRSNSVLIDVEGRQQSIRWVEAQIDGLDIDIALQHFEDAVARVEKLRKLARSIKGNAMAQEIILAKVDERAAKLAQSVGRQLVLTSAGTEKTKGQVAWLLRLSYEEMARTQYLDSRTETIRLRTRALPFTGALPPYLHALAFTTFTLLLHTFKTFSGSFPASSGSAVVKWAKERVDEFNEQLERQLSNVERGSELWEECIRTVKEQAGVLGEVGVDFSSLVAKGLEGPRANGVARKGATGLGVST
ncbi:hypothetical protein LTR36_004301 [Oleoguttula mirabilis]|uniref:Exocyst complex component EXO84 n=1 Tax=Oleoguttula mirabilis TaxID=1507867 RepID=A0AAV9JGI2_9PEZI|nr:hypothetical protein LTR36_004301 [Oleoguttula mirabilis]